MAEKLLFEIVTPERLIFSEEVDEVTVPGAEGEFGVLPGHVPFLSALQIGKLALKQGGREHVFAVSGGFVEVHEDHVILLAESAERSDEIDMERTLNAKSRAEQVLKEISDPTDPGYVEADQRLRRALNRESVAKGS